VIVPTQPLPIDEVPILKIARAADLADEPATTHDVPAVHRLVEALVDVLRQERRVPASERALEPSSDSVEDLAARFDAIAGNLRRQIDDLEAIVTELRSRQQPNAAETNPERLFGPTSQAESPPEESPASATAPEIAAANLLVGADVEPAPADPVPEPPAVEPAPATTQSPAEGLFRKGAALLQSGDVAQALAYFSESIRRDPTFVPAYLERGQARRQRGELADALDDFTTALTHEPQRAEAFVRRGNVLIDQGRFDEAIADYTAALALEPDQALVYMNRALAQARKGEFEQVIADAGEALARNVRLTGALFLRGAAFMNLGRCTEALADFDQLIRLEPQNALAYNERGLVHARTGEYERAVTDYDRALQFDAKLLLPRYNRGLARRLKGEHEDAVEDFNHFLQRRPRNSPALYQRGLARLDLGRLDEALADFEAALALNPEFKEADIGRRRALKAKSKRQAQPARKQAEPAAADAAQQQLRIVCPGCGAVGQVRWDRLDSLLQCAGCSRHYRMLADGALEEVQVQKGIWVSVRSFLPGASRHWVPLPKDTAPPPAVHRRRRMLVGAAAVFLLAGLGTGAFFALRPAPVQEEPLPVELEARAERFAHAWVGNDRTILTRLTSPTHDRVLRSWLINNAAPAAPDDPGSLRVDVKVVKTKPGRAELTLQLAGLPGERSSLEVRQNWEQRGGVWFFMPPQDFRKPPPVKGVSSIAAPKPTSTKE
jgi:tetratricopeptide (TPR) repeat protein